MNQYGQNFATGKQEKLMLGLARVSFLPIMFANKMVRRYLAIGH